MSYTTVGGFGVIFAYFITPQFRGLNRLSVFIAFISILFLWELIRDLNLLRAVPNHFKKFIELSIGVFLVAVVLVEIRCQ